MTSMTMLNSSNCHQESLYIPSSTPNQSLIYTSTPSSPPSLQTPSQQQQQRIAPKLTSHHHHYLQEDPADLLRCKRRIQLGQLPPKGPQPVAVARRNERERNRVRLVNLGFATLRQHVPATSKNKKMSKVDTLRSAVDYIKRLKELLGETSGLDENAYPGHSGQSSTGSPTPSMCSEASSPYEVMHGDEEEELMDFANWF